MIYLTAYKPGMMVDTLLLGFIYSYYLIFIVYISTLASWYIVLNSQLGVQESYLSTHRHILL